MKVQEARIIGFLMGLTSSVTSFAYNSLISLGIGSMGKIFFSYEKKLLKAQMERGWKVLEWDYFCQFQSNNYFSFIEN